jgi:hypothetical protein
LSKEPVDLERCVGADLTPSEKKSLKAAIENEKKEREQAKIKKFRKGK